jgi:hypothetical protein
MDDSYQIHHSEIPLSPIDRTLTSIAIAYNNQVIAELNQIGPKEKKGRALMLKKHASFRIGADQTKTLAMVHGGVYLGAEEDGYILVAVIGANPDLH